VPYNKTSELPASVKDHLPNHAQEIYKSAFNNAWEEYKSSQDRRDDSSREEVAHKVAWTAVKKKYKKQGDQWVAK
jgi:cation transport regulator